jgi:hypothetical protein
MPKSPKLRWHTPGRDSIRQSGDEPQAVLQWTNSSFGLPPICLQSMPEEHLDMQLIERSSFRSIRTEKACEPPSARHLRTSHHSSRVFQPRIALIASSSISILAISCGFDGHARSRRSGKKQETPLGINCHLMMTSDRTSSEILGWRFLCAKSES